MTDHAGVPPNGGAPVPPDGGSPVPPSGDAAVPRSGGAPRPVLPADARRPLQPSDADGSFDVGHYDTGRLQQLPTGQLLLVGRPGVPDQVLAPVVEEADDDDEVQRRVYSWIGAVAGSIGALASLFVGWMLPLSLAAIVFGVLGLRREEHGRTLAFVAIGTGITGLVFSAVWLGYYAIVYGALPA
ncbi:hypothetical protein [Agromyces silvae]|uniref:hypothetical protein n=1 Tax=Agromyces silvae TaxID=3388266 RepID=UPI00280B73AD|nr:hypothetical protein [Agromyces protaetiae]